MKVLSQCNTYYVLSVSPNFRRYDTAQNMNKNCLQCNKEIEKKNRIKYCSLSCRFESMKGKKRSLTTRQKMSTSHIGNKSRTGEIYSDAQRKKLSEAMPKGEKHWNWKGGIQSINHRLRNSIESKEWNRKVKERDKHKCKIGNSDCGGRLEAHHILPFSEFPDLRFDVNNGITLCRFHHPLGVRQSIKLSPYFQQLVK